MGKAFSQKGKKVSNYQGVGRTNYFRYKDLDGLKKALEPFIYLELHTKTYLGDTLVCILDISESGDFYHEDKNGNSFEFEDHILPYMDEEYVLVVMHSGHCKHSYIGGSATAYYKDEVITIRLEDIYNEIFDRFHIQPSKAEE